VVGWGGVVWGCVGKTFLWVTDRCLFFLMFYIGKLLQPGPHPPQRFIALQSYSNGRRKSRRIGRIRMEIGAR